MLFRTRSVGSLKYEETPVPTGRVFSPLDAWTWPFARPLLLLFDLWDEDDPKKPLEVGGCRYSG